MFAGQIQPDRLEAQAETCYNKKMESKKSAKKQLVVFDMNKTLIKEVSWYELNLAMGITPEEDEMLYRLGPEKESVLSYAEWIKLLAKMMKSRGRATRTNIENVILNYEFMDGAKEVISELHKRGYTTAIISGSFDSIVDRVAHELEIQHAFSNTYLVFDTSDYLDHIVMTWDDYRYKPMILKSVCRRFGLDPKNVVYVADGDNDMGIFEQTIGVSLQSPQLIHEPWKQNAIEKGEKFSLHDAASKAQHNITDLRQLLEIL